MKMSKYQPTEQGRVQNELGHFFYLTFVFDLWYLALSLPKVTCPEPAEGACP